MSIPTPAGDLGQQAHRHELGGADGESADGEREDREVDAAGSCWGSLVCWSAAGARSVSVTPSWLQNTPMAPDHRPPDRTADRLLWTSDVRKRAPRCVRSGVVGADTRLPGPLDPGRLPRYDAAEPPTAAAHRARVDYRETSRRPRQPAGGLTEAVGAAVGSRVIEGAAPVMMGSPARTLAGCAWPTAAGEDGGRGALPAGGGGGAGPGRTPTPPTRPAWRSPRWAPRRWPTSSRARSARCSPARNGCRPRRPRSPTARRAGAGPVERLLLEHATEVAGSPGWRPRRCRETPSCTATCDWTTCSSTAPAARTSWTANCCALARRGWTSSG